MDEKTKKRVFKYFRQKNWTVLDILILAVTVVSLFFATFVRNGGPIGLPVGVVALFFLVCLRSAKVKDGEIDEIAARLIAERPPVSEEKGECVTLPICFDLRAGRIVKGKDGKLRSPVFAAVSVRFDKERTRLSVCRVDLREGTAEEETYVLSPGDPIRLVKETVSAPGGATAEFLSSPVFSDAIPVSLRDFDSAKVVERLCGEQEKG